MDCDYTDTDSATVSSSECSSPAELAKKLQAKLSKPHM